MLGGRLIEKEKTTVSGRGRCHTINRATSPRTRAKVSLFKVEEKTPNAYNVGVEHMKCNTYNWCFRSKNCETTAGKSAISTLTDTNMGGWGS